MKKIALAALIASGLVLGSTTSSFAVDKPTTKPAMKPAAKPAMKPAAEPAMKPAAKPAMKPAAK